MPASALADSLPASSTSGFLRTRRIYLVGRDRDACRHRWRRSFDVTKPSSSKETSGYEASGNQLKDFGGVSTPRSFSACDERAISARASSSRLLSGRLSHSRLMRPSS